MDNKGPHFARVLRDALSMRAKHGSIFDDFTKTFPPATVQKWKDAIERWEAEPSSQPDPFDDSDVSSTNLTYCVVPSLTRFFQLSQ